MEFVSGGWLFPVQGRFGGAWGVSGRRSGWGGSVEERGSIKGFVGGGWAGEGVCNGVGGGGSGRSRLDVGTRLKGGTVTGNGLGGV